VIRWLTDRFLWLGDRRWTLAGPVALIAGVIILALWLDIATGGEAKPPPLLGDLGTPVRGTFVPPTPTPLGARPTPLPRPTIAGGVAGTPEERDAQRRADLLVIFDALLQLRAREGSFPSTNNNIQSLCVYRDIDAGCSLIEVLNADPPGDPLGEPGRNGYWYQSDGASAKVYASLEGEIDDSERCDTDYVEFEDDPNLVCPSIP
jgi:hypothetical protein